MVIDPRMLRRAIPPKAISEPTPCRFCGYDLIGLMNDARCPECGKPIKPKDGLRYGADQMVEAPIQYLRLLALGGNLMLFGWLGIAVGILWLSTGPHVGGVVVYLGGAVAWWAGVMLTARPRPSSERSTENRMREWLELRLAGQITQAFWILSAGFAAAWVTATVRGGGAGLEWLDEAALGAGAVATGGLIPVSLFIANLGYWASDTTLAIRLRTLVVLIPLIPISLIGVGAGMWPLGQWLMASKAASLTGFLVIGAAIVLLPTLAFTWCLWAFRQDAAWSVANHKAVEAKDARFRSRSDEESRRGAMLSEGVDPGSLPGFNLAASSEVPASVPRSLHPGNAARKMGKKKSGDPNPYELSED